GSAYTESDRRLKAPAPRRVDSFSPRKIPASLERSAASDGRKDCICEVFCIDSVYSHPIPAFSGPPVSSAALPSDVPDDAPRVLRLKRGEERRLAAGHLWVFSNEIDTDATPLTTFRPGALAELRSNRDAFIGYVYVNPHALICARILSHDPARPIDAALIQTRLRAALALREELSDKPFYRWVYGESDLLPRLVLDRSGDGVVGQTATAGMEALKEEVSEAVRRTLAPRALYWKNDTAARELEHLPQLTETAFGEAPGELEIEEGGLSFRVPLAAGQKTGWFYDQTANRARLARYVSSGARVLDVCAYAGAWALAALSQGAASAHCLD